MNIQEKRESLRQQPDTIEIEIRGETHHWSFGRWGLRLARKAGIDADGLFETFAGVETDADGELVGGNVLEMMERTGDLLAIGLLPFSDDAADLVDTLSLKELSAVAPQLLRAMEGLTDDEAADASGDGDEGNGPAPPSTGGAPSS